MNLTDAIQQLFTDLQDIAQLIAPIAAVDRISWPRPDVYGLQLAHYRRLEARQPESC